MATDPTPNSPNGLEYHVGSTTPRAQQPRLFTTSTLTDSGSETAGVSTSDTLPSSTPPKPLFFKRAMPAFAIHFVLWLAMTAYFTGAMLINPNNKNASLLILLYTFLSCKLFFKHFSTRLITRPLAAAWNTIVRKPLGMIPKRPRRILLHVAPVVAILVVILSSEESDKGTRIDRVCSLVGLALQIGLLYLTSTVCLFKLTLVVVRYT